MTVPRALLALLAAASLGCASTGEGPAVDAALQRYAALVRAKNHRGIVAMFEPDGVIMNADEPSIHGRKAIERALSGPSRYVVITYSLTPLRTVVAGNTGTQVGTFRRKLGAPDGKVIEVTGRFDAEWGRDGSGGWLLRRFGLGPPE